MKTIGDTERAKIYSLAREKAWSILEACNASGGGIRAAAGSALYPHVWTRDACIASLGILAARRHEKDVAFVTDSLATLFRHQTSLGRMPLKVDVEKDVPVAENSAGVDGGLWVAITVDTLRRTVGEEAARPFIKPALDAIHWSLHLDVNGCGLLESPEASDWADMLPHRHNVLGTNVLFYAALQAGGRLAMGEGDASKAAELTARADDVRRKINLLFWPGPCTDADGTARWLSALEKEYPEWGLTGMVVAPRGEIPFYLPYVGFRTAGRHCDVTGNLLAILTGVAPEDRGGRILDHLQDTGCGDPAPSKAIDPPILPGDPDWRDYFLWRDLNRPHRYQNGGSWPFIGSFHVAALAQSGRRDAARQHLDALVAACYDDGRWTFPEWQHGLSGQAMGESHQAWSASGLLYAMEAVEKGSSLVWNPKEA